MRNNKQKPIRLLASFLVAMLVALLLPQAAMAQHTTTHRNVESGSASTTTETKKTDSSSSKSKKQSSAKKEKKKKKKKSQEPVTYQREEEDKLPANYQGGFHFGDMTHVSGTAGNRTSTDTPAHLFVVRPMAIANGLNGASYKVVQKFLETYYDNWERKEKKNESIMLSAAGGYTPSYAGVRPTYVYANFEKKKFHDYAYYFTFSDATHKESDVKAFVKRFSDDLAKQGMRLAQVTPVGNELYRAEYQGEKKVCLTYEKVGAYYGVLLAVEF